MRTNSAGTVRSGSVAVLVAMLLIPAEARSQELAETTAVTVGTRVRILAPSLTGKRIEGMVLETTESALLIGVNDRVPLKVSRQAITQLEVSLGQHRQVLKGAIIGAGIGVALFALTGASYQGDEPNTSGDWAHFIGVGLAGGAIWGVGIGALVKGDRWSPVPLEHVHVSLGPTRGHGVGASVSLRF